MGFKNAGEFAVPTGVGGGDVLAGVGFDGGDSGDVGGEAGGMDERGTGAGEVLDAEEHFELLSGCGHEEGLGLALAGFEGGSGIAHFPG